MQTKVIALLKTASLVLALGLSVVTIAHAQWGWTDKSGRRIFSDQGPTSDVPEKNIFKRPAGSKAPAIANAPEPQAAAGATTADGTATAAKSGASAPKLTGKDAELEKKKKELEATEAAKKKAEADKIAAQKADNCDRIKKSKANLTSGTRIATTNAKGEREIMGDAERAAEIKRLDDLAATECK
jgi:Domain of unknown function (DUF4124)